mgnify:CR=1 FL=1
MSRLELRCPNGVYVCQRVMTYDQPKAPVTSPGSILSTPREQPNLVVFTGDNVWYPGNTDIVAAQAALTKPLNDAGVPYMLTFGNHGACLRASVLVPPVNRVC